MRPGILHGVRPPPVPPPGQLPNPGGPQGPGGDRAPHQAPQEEEPHPHQIQEDHKALEVEVVDHHQAPQ